MLTKLQITFCVLAGLGIIVFGVGMVSNVNVAKVPGWLAPVAWGSSGLIFVSCIGVVTTLALDRDKEPGSDEDDEEEELLPVDESASDEAIPELTTVEDTATVSHETVDHETVDHESVADEFLAEETVAHESAPHETVSEAPAEIDFADPGNEETIEFSSDPFEE